MFTGLVEAVGTVAALERRADAVVLEIAPTVFAPSDLAIGESIAHDGVCLTVTAVTARTYTVLAGAETLARTTIGGLAVGARVNLERALALGARLGGHMVAGHVDGVGTLVGREDRGANLWLQVAVPGELLRYVIAKGSIAIDGISLTVNGVDPPGGRHLDVALIPHTRDHTSLGDRRPGDRVNLEVDMIAKYVERLTAGYRLGASIGTSDGGTP
jgi:riboflavin synthase